MGFTDNQIMELAISFVKSLPYSYDIDTTGLEGYKRYPIETLADSTGDCEDTAKKEPF